MGKCERNQTNCIGKIRRHSPANAITTQLTLSVASLGNRQLPVEKKKEEKRKEMFHRILILFKIILMKFLCISSMCPRQAHTNYSNQPQKAKNPSSAIVLFCEKFATFACNFLKKV